MDNNKRLVYCTGDLRSRPETPWDRVLQSDLWREFVARVTRDDPPGPRPSRSWRRRQTEINTLLDDQRPTRARRPSDLHALCAWFVGHLQERSDVRELSIDIDFRTVCPDVARVMRSQGAGLRRTRVPVTEWAFPASASLWWFTGFRGLLVSTLFYMARNVPPGSTTDAALRAAAQRGYMVNYARREKRIDRLRHADCGYNCSACRMLLIMGEK